MLFQTIKSNIRTNLFNTYHKMNKVSEYNKIQTLPKIQVIPSDEGAALERTIVIQNEYCKEIDKSIIYNQV